MKRGWKTMTERLTGRSPIDGTANTAFKLHVIKTRDFIRLDGKGNPDMTETRRILAAIAKTCVDRGVDCALLDVREARTDMTDDELLDLASAFQEMGFREKHRLAVLHRPFGTRADLFAAFASQRGWNVRAFDHYESAIEWFSTALPIDDA